MDITTIILKAAKLVHVSGTLLLAVCTHESGDFKHNYAAMDKGSPSFGSCQVKYETSKMLGFKGKPQELMDPKINSLYAAKYLKYQQSRYGEDWVKLVASYNSGSYLPSPKIKGCPRNLQYLRLVRAKLPNEYKQYLNCGNTEVADNL